MDKVARDHAATSSHVVELYGLNAGKKPTLRAVISKHSI
jgi:hypothetical protein